MRFLAIFAACLFLLGTAPAFAQDAAAASSSGGGGGLRMGTSYCSGASFDCDSLSSNQSAIIDAANTCVNTRFGIQDKIMASFSTSGEFENCVVPGSTSGLQVWAVCCIKKSSDGQCDLTCTRYLGQGK